MKILVYQLIKKLFLILVTVLILVSLVQYGFYDNEEAFKSFVILSLVYITIKIDDLKVSQEG